MMGGAEGEDDYLMIDLCCSDDDEEDAGGSFARQLNLLFDGDVEIVGERLAPPGGASAGAGGSGGGASSAAPSQRAGGKAKMGSGASTRPAGTGADREDAIEIDDDESQEAGWAGVGAPSGSAAADDDDEDDDDDADARMARQIQRQLDSAAEEEASWQAKKTTDDEALARRIQARLADELASDGVGIDEAPSDILRGQRNKIKQWLAQNAAALRVSDVTPVPSAQPGGVLYNRFAAAYNALRDKSVRLVFHGTREENIADICAHGLDPTRRGKNGQALGAGEYFAENVNISLPYCVGGQRMLVFAVLMDRSGLTKRQSGIVVVHKPEHQLPMFILTFDAMHGAMAAAGINPALAARLAASGGSAAMLAQLRSLMGMGMGMPPTGPPPPPAYVPPAGRPRAPAGGARGKAPKRPRRR
jgi:hypothetical protein